jgi:hypothetical protein
MFGLIETCFESLREELEWWLALDTLKSEPGAKLSIVDQAYSAGAR